MVVVASCCHEDISRYSQDAHLSEVWAELDPAQARKRQMSSVLDGAAVKPNQYTFVFAYARVAVESGRLTPKAAVEEALEAWERRVQAEQLVGELLDRLDREDDSCRSCGAELGTIHAAWCERSTRP